MATETFPLEKIFGSRTRVKVITLFTTGVKRPYFVREISRIIDERLNAVRRELEILERVGMLHTYEERRRKYYVVNENFSLYRELSSIMQKAGPGVQDVLFQHIESVGDIRYACVTGYFTGADNAPTDLFIVGQVNEQKLAMFAGKIEKQIGREISYTPMTINEYQYRLNFNDMFLRQIFNASHKEIVNNLPRDLQPQEALKRSNATIIQHNQPS